MSLYQMVANAKSQDASMGRLTSKFPVSLQRALGLINQIIFPRTIFWRLFGLTARSMLLSLLFVVALFSYNRINIVANSMADQAGEMLANAEDELDRLSPAEQKLWLQRTQKPYLPHLAALDNPNAPTADMVPHSLSTMAITRVLRHKLAGVGEVREVPPPRRQLWVKVDMLGRPMWMVIPLGRVRADPTWQFTTAAFIFTLMSLAVSAIFAWRVNLPLRELRLAAARLGRGERPEQLPEMGPLEVKELSASFNRMLTDLATNEQERNVMLAGISHDLRTPLARLRLGVEMMQDDSLQDGMREDIGDIERILGQFIAFSRGLGGEDAVTTDPADLARSLLTRYAREQCDIELDIADDVPLVPLRPLAMTRALANIIDNARRYGEPPLKLRIAQDGHRLLFEVSDHGSGIPEEQLEDALKPFHRLDTARRADGGSGLGFAIVDRIARLHGGKLTLSNRVGGGLVCSLCIPLEN
jgi:two-component system osmolarity sensor histidine kinase EnvZ